MSHGWQSKSGCWRSSTPARTYSGFRLSPAAMSRVWRRIIYRLPIGIQPWPDCALRRSSTTPDESMLRFVGEDVLALTVEYGAIRGMACQQRRAISKPSRPVGGSSPSCVVEPQVVDESDHGASNRITAGEPMPVVLDQRGYWTLKGQSSRCGKSMWPKDERI